MIHWIFSKEKISWINPDSKPVFSVEVHEDSIEYQPFIKCDPVTGVIEIEKPDLEFKDSEKLKMVKFTGKMTDSEGTAHLTTNTQFFFDVNPDFYSEDLDNDITQALTDIQDLATPNSVSLTWWDDGEIVMK